MTTKLTVLVAGSTRMLGTKIVSASWPLAISASYVLKLLGRFERISMDTVMRRYFKEISGQKNATDDDINAYYKRFGECKGLVAFWEVSRRADEKCELSF